MVMSLWPHFLAQPVYIHTLVDCNPLTALRAPSTVQCCICRHRSSSNMARETCLMLLVFSEFRSGNERSLSGRFVPGNETHWRSDGVAAASSDGGPTGGRDPRQL